MNAGWCRAWRPDPWGVRYGALRMRAGRSRSALMTLGGHHKGAVALVRVRLEVVLVMCLGREKPMGQRTMALPVGL